VGELPGARRALCDRRTGCYEEVEVELRGDVTYYLITDGFMDQAGGEHGYGFGKSRLWALLRDHAHLPMHDQAGALDRALEAYRGSHLQRDDITVLSFRIA
jgi:Serine phosphatase RsbU, regulator of sigma subunit